MSIKNMTTTKKKFILPLIKQPAEYGTFTKEISRPEQSHASLSLSPNAHSLHLDIGRYPKFSEEGG